LDTTGGYLRLDVTTGESVFVPLEAKVLRRFLGGSGLGTYLVLRAQEATCDPFTPPSVLVFTFSPLVGSPLTTSSKFAVVGKSPLTGRINDSLASSGFAIAGKQTGCDALMITGRASEPSIVLVDDGHVRLEPAGPLWGLPCDEAEACLRDRLGDEWQMAVIGPAGERLVRFATISHSGRHAGRGGSGAILGSKNVKMVAVRGSKTVAWANSQQLVEFSESLSARSFGPATAKYRELGTAANLLKLNRLGALRREIFRAVPSRGPRNYHRRSCPRSAKRPGPTAPRARWAVNTFTR